MTEHCVHRVWLKQQSGAHRVDSYEIASGSYPTNTGVDDIVKADERPKQASVIRRACCCRTKSFCPRIQVAIQTPTRRWRKKLSPRSGSCPSTDYSVAGSWQSTEDEQQSDLPKLVRGNTFTASSSTIVGRRNSLLLRFCITTPGLYPAYPVECWLSNLNLGF